MRQRLSQAALRARDIGLGNPPPTGSRRGAPRWGTSKNRPPRKGITHILLDGINHVAVLTGDTDRFTAFYEEVFGATSVVLQERDGFKVTMVRIGPTAELNVFELAGNTESQRQITDFGHILSLFFRDPDGLKAEVCVINPDARPGVHNPRGPRHCDTTTPTSRRRIGSPTSEARAGGSVCADGSSPEFVEDLAERLVTVGTHLLGPLALHVLDRGERGSANTVSSWGSSHEHGATVVGVGPGLDESQIFELTNSLTDRLFGDPGAVSDRRGPSSVGIDQIKDPAMGSSEGTHVLRQETTHVCISAAAQPFECREYMGWGFSSRIVNHVDDISQSSLSFQP